MRWFEGGMLQAIAEAQRKRVLLLVFIDGEDKASLVMRAAFEDPAIGKLIEALRCVPVRLRANSSACRSFSLCYPVAEIPATFLITAQGRLEASVSGFVDPAALEECLTPLVASSSLHKVESDVRDPSEATLIVNRMLKATQQSAPVPTKLATDDKGGAKDSEVLRSDVAAARKKRNRKYRRGPAAKTEAVVQTSIPVLAERSTQFNPDDIRSYMNLLAKLGKVEGIQDDLARPSVEAAARIHAEFAASYASLLYDEDRNPVVQPPPPIVEEPKSHATEEGQQPQCDLDSGSEGERQKGGDHKEFQAEATMDELTSIAVDQLNSAFEGILDGPAMLSKFVSLAQEFAENLFSGSDADASKLLRAANKPEEPAQPEQGKKHPAKKQEPAVRPREKPKAREVPKKTCRLESGAATVGDTPVTRQPRDERPKAEESDKPPKTTQKKKRKTADTPAVSVPTMEKAKNRERRVNAGDARRGPRKAKSRDILSDHVAQKIREWEARKAANASNVADIRPKMQAKPPTIVEDEEAVPEPPAAKPSPIRAVKSYSPSTDDRTIYEEYEAEKVAERQDVPEWLEQVARGASRRALDRAEDSQQNVSQPIKAPTKSPSKHRVTISDVYVPPSQDPATPKTTSHSGNCATKRASTVPQSKQAPRAESVEEVGRKTSDPLDIVFSFPDGTSAVREFPPDTYLDEVRWHAEEEVLARGLPSCFPITLARRNPLSEFSREDYRRTLRELDLGEATVFLVLPRATSAGRNSMALRAQQDDPNWALLFRLLFGVFVSSPLSFVWNLLTRQSRERVRKRATASESRSSGARTRPTNRKD